MHLRSLSFFGWLLCFSLNAFAGPDTLKVINWNIEWFGTGSSSHVTTQTQKVKLLMQALDADVYALTEIVNVDSLESVANTLGPDFSWYVSSYGSFAASPASPDYAGAQKMAFIYRKSKVKVTNRRPFLKSSPTSYYSFSSGRYPYLVETEVLGADAQWHPVAFVILHAKAMSDDNSCNRRMNGAKEMKDSLDLYFAGKNFLVLGDFNDDLDESICSSFTASNYQVFLTDTAHYEALTLPLSTAGISSISGYSSYLDHVIASKEMAAYYIPGSAASLKSFVTGEVPSYTSQVSDHYPTETKFRLYDEAPALVADAPLAFALKLFPNPAHGQLTAAANEAFQFQIVAPNGQLVQSGQLQRGSNTLSLAGMMPGIYWLKAWNNNGRVVKRFVVQ